MTMLGLAGGILASLLLIRFLSGILYGIDANDTVTYLGSVLLVSFLSLLASLLPAWRAGCLDPTRALRAD